MEENAIGPESGAENNGSVKYVALLRGINVGGKNLVSMAAVRAVLEQLQFKNVSTYIQSGNVLFESRHKDPLKLSSILEDALADEFGFACVAVVLTQAELSQVVTHAPTAFGTAPSQYRYDVAFSKQPMNVQDILSTMRLRDGVDLAFATNNVLYLQKLIQRSSQSYLPKLIDHPAYKRITIRNWRTVTELYALRCR